MKGYYKINFQIERNGELSLDLGNPLGQMPPPDVSLAQAEFIGAIINVLKQLTGDRLNQTAIINGLDKAYDRFSSVLTEHGHTGKKWINAWPSSSQGDPLVTGHFLFQ